MEGLSNLRHALAGDCGDLDCEIHYPDVGVQENVVSPTNLAFFIAGATMASAQLLNEVEDAFETILKENFIQYHEEALNIYEAHNEKPQSLDAAQHYEQEDR